MSRNAGLGAADRGGNAGPSAGRGGQVRKGDKKAQATSPFEEAKISAGEGLLREMLEEKRFDTNGVVAMLNRDENIDENIKEAAKILSDHTSYLAKANEQGSPKEPVAIRLLNCMSRENFQEIQKIDPKITEVIKNAFSNSIKNKEFQEATTIYELMKDFAPNESMVSKEIESLMQKVKDTVDMVVKVNKNMQIYLAHESYRKRQANLDERRHDFEREREQRDLDEQRHDSTLAQENAVVVGDVVRDCKTFNLMKDALYCAKNLGLGKGLKNMLEAEDGKMLKDIISVMKRNVYTANGDVIALLEDLGFPKELFEGIKTAD
ncbi:MAG: hypothetical protein ACOX3T_04160 [Bdellovibrionota bacterium]